MVHLCRKEYGDSLKKKKNTVPSKKAGVEGGTILLYNIFNIVIRGSPEQRCEGNPMNIRGRASRQREDQTLKQKQGHTSQ